MTLSKETSANTNLITGRHYSIKTKLAGKKASHTYEDCKYLGYNPKSKTYSWMHDNELIIIGYVFEFEIYKRVEGELTLL